MKRVAFLVVTAALVAACGSDSTSPGTATAVGTWSLSTYDGRTLPVTISQNALGKVEFVDDVFTLTADSRYVETGHLRSTPTSGAATTTAQGDVGSYTNANGTVTFTSSAGNGVDVGTIAGNKMTVIFQAHTLVYVRGG